MNFGLRSNRDNDHWAKPKALDGKVVIPADREFFLNAGGRCGARTRAFHLAYEEAKKRAEQVDTSGASSQPAKPVRMRRRAPRFAAYEDFKAF